MEDFTILDRRRLPARIAAEQVAPLLGFKSHDVQVLVKSRLLKPLGNPLPNAVKYFAAVEIEGCAKDVSWLGRATKAIYAYWARHNNKRSAKKRIQATLMPVAA